MAASSVGLETISHIIGIAIIVPFVIMLPIGIVSKFKDREFDGFAIFIKDYFGDIIIHVIALGGGLWLISYAGGKEDEFYVGFLSGAWAVIFTWWWWWVKLPSRAKRSH